MPILTASDFSEGSETALRWAAREARRLDKKLTVLHCLGTDPVSRLWDYVAGHPKEYVDRARKKIRDSIDHLPDPIRPEKIDVKVVHQTPEVGVMDEIENTDPDLLTIGTTGQGKLESLVLGTTSEHLIRTSSVPVLAVPARASDVEVDTILAPVDATAWSEASLKLATDKARQYSARLLIHHAFTLPTVEHFTPREDALPENVEAYEQNQWNQFETFLEQFDFSGVEYDTILRLQSPVASIRRALQVHDIDLITMGLRKQRGLEQFVTGSSSTKILHETPCPVLLAKG